jgi:SAM-dependent methyltransferase
MQPIYAQYGCGLCAPDTWLNFDSSPTLRLQKTPVLSVLLRRRLNVVFPDNVKYGDIITGLPLQDNSLDGIYCSHVLEHLSLDDCRAALSNTYRILKPGGIFRCVVPDLEYSARKYLAALEGGDKEAACVLVETDTGLGLKTRPRNIKGRLALVWGNAKHLWLWDYPSLASELALAGFTRIRRCEFNDGPEIFKAVEVEGRFRNCLAIECFK